MPRGFKNPLPPPVSIPHGCDDDYDDTKTTPLLTTSRSNHGKNSDKSIGFCSLGVALVAGFCLQLVTVGLAFFALRHQSPTPCWQFAAYCCVQTIVLACGLVGVVRLLMYLRNDSISDEEAGSVWKEFFGTRHLHREAPLLLSAVLGTCLACLATEQALLRNDPPTQPPRHWWMTMVPVLGMGTIYAVMLAISKICSSRHAK